jgi:hypothetical protein
MRVHNCVQMSCEWWELRRGVPTASEFHRVVMPASGKPSTSAAKYIAQLIADEYDLIPAVLTERPNNPAMRHGNECEPEARAWYAFETGHEVRQVGFVTTDDGRLGCSPDGIIVEAPECDGLILTNGYLGGLELKCPQPKAHEAYLRKGRLPTEYRCQVHGQLVVTGLPWVDFVSYCPETDPLLVRVEPDEFTELLRKELASFVRRHKEARDAIRGAVEAAQKRKAVTA